MTQREHLLAALEDCMVGVAMPAPARRPLPHWLRSSNGLRPPMASLLLTGVNQHTSPPRSIDDLVAELDRAGPHPKEATARQLLAHGAAAVQPLLRLL